MTSVSLDRRATLLAHNAYIWEDCFVRLEGQRDGQTLADERFASRLVVVIGAQPGISDRGPPPGGWSWDPPAATR
jgi:hypothetical protein